MSRIRISKDHGLNPSISVCWFCGQDKNELILFGALPKDERAPRNVCVDMEPCDECKKHMEMGILVLEVKDGTLDPVEEVNCRTGKMAVLREEAFMKMSDALGWNFDPKKNRFAFVNKSTLEQLLGDSYDEVFKGDCNE